MILVADFTFGYLSVLYGFFFISDYDLVVTKWMSLPYLPMMFPIYKANHPNLPDGLYTAIILRIVL
jgi:hypothetical protein